MSNNVAASSRNPAPTISGKKEQVNVRLTEKARKILQRLSGAMGISQADVLELMLREEEKRKAEK